MLEGKVFTQVSSEFVSPLFPEEGEEVELKIRFAGDVEVEEIFCVTNRNGVNWRWSPVSVSDDKTCAFKVEGAWKPERLRWYFVFRTEGRYRYFSKEGVTVFPPPVKSHFALVPGLDSPLWAASATCYQVFPDRFRNGDPSVGLKSEYDYDSGRAHTRGWGEKPEPWEKARCLDFYNGDLKGIEDAIPHFLEEGVTCLYINPINSSPSVHRFDSTDYFHVDEKLGGDKALESLISKCHENGIRVIVDISINHTSTEHPWFKAASEGKSPERDYYYISPGGEVGCWNDVPTMPQLNFNSGALRDLLYRSPDSAMRKYLKAPYGQDGWRLDVAPELGRRGVDQLCKEVWREVRRSLHEENSGIYLVGEDWNDASEYIDGDMWDATMNYYGSGRPLRSWMGERDRFLSGGWGHDPQADNPYDAYELALALQSSMDASGNDLSRFFRMNLFDSHDTPRLHNNAKVWDQDVYEGVVMALHLLPGMPNIYYGDEVGLGGEMGSVEGSRWPMEWDEAKWNASTWNVHKALGAMRKDPALAFASTWFIPLDKDCLLIARTTGDKTWALLLNKGPERILPMPELLSKGEGWRTICGAEAGDLLQNGRILLQNRRSSVLESL